MGDRWDSDAVREGWRQIAQGRQDRHDQMHGHHVEPSHFPRVGGEACQTFLELRRSSGGQMGGDKTT